MKLGLELTPQLKQEARQRQELTQAQKLEQKQKVTLRKMMRLRHEAHHPEIPEAIRGIEGLKVADEILKSKNLIGILIGGLLETAWQKDSALEDFEQHKDVDVLVYDLNGAKIRNFEGGIDWWLPKRANVRLSEGSVIETNFYENANGIKLAFNVSKSIKENIPSGLHIPSFDFALAMRKAEIIAMLDPKKYLVDDKVLKSFKKEIIKDDIQTNRSRSLKDTGISQIGFPNPDVFSIINLSNQVYLALKNAKDEDYVEVAKERFIKN